MRSLILTLVFVVGLIGAPLGSRAQEGSEPVGICEGAICGPAGSFSVESFPTITPIEWDQFPARGERPYTASRREWIVAMDGRDDNEGLRTAPLATIGRAVELPQPGDVIWVGDGEYRIDEGLILNTAGVTLAAEHIGGVTLVPASTDVPVGIQALADDLIVDGFVISGFGVGIELGNTEQTQHNLRIQHVRVEQAEEGIRAAYGSSGAAVIDGLLVYDVWLREISSIGMQCGEGPCDHMRWEALRVEMGNGDTGNSGLDGLAVEAGRQMVVFNVDVSGASADGIDLKAAEVAVGNVIVHQIGRNGIKLWAGGDIINALVYETGADAAIVLETGNTYRVLNTVVARHSVGESAYTMTVAYDNPDQGGYVEIINSAFYQNSGAIWISPAFEVDLRGVIVFGTANGEALVLGDQSIPDGDVPLHAVGGSGDVDPLFTDPDNGDYTWAAESVMHDTGWQIEGLPDFDLYGMPRVSGAEVDIGPWEMQE